MATRINMRCGGCGSPIIGYLEEGKDYFAMWGDTEGMEPEYHLCRQCLDKQFIQAMMAVGGNYKRP